MRRWLFAFLLLIVPFQLVWASAAPYCTHETSIAVKKHFGHHEHQHQAGGDLTPAADDNSDAPAAFHADCESCHLGCSAVLHSSTPEVHALPHAGALPYPGPRFTSHVPSGPHRPDRADLAPAARFGGGVAVVSLAG